MGEDWREKLAAFYNEVDAAISAKGWTCRGCGECCHFDVVDHILYAGTLERRYLLESASLATHPDGSAELLARGLRCPYQENGRCTAREARPLGCRLHFCEAGEGGDNADFFEYWHSRLKQVHSDSGQSWDYRPLLPL